MKFVRKIKNKLKKFQKNSNYKFIEKEDSSILLDGFSIELNNPIEEKKYLKIGDKSILAGRFVFEKESGYVSIGDRTYIGGSTFISVDGIEVGNDVTMAWGCTIYDHSSHSIYWDERKNDTRDWYNAVVSGKNPYIEKNWDVVPHKAIRICDKVWIGYGVSVLKGVTIGEGAVIGAQSVVTHDIPAWTVACGNPAKVVKEIKRNVKLDYCSE